MMQHSTVLAITLALTTAAMCGACACNCAGSGPADGAAGEGAMHAPDYTGSWSLRTLGGEQVSSLVPADARGPTLEINGDGSVAGFAGVNRLSSRFDAAAAARGEPLFGPVATTKMAGPAPLMAVESRFTQALADARSASIEAGDLVLLDSAGSRLASFRPSGQ